MAEFHKNLPVEWAEWPRAAQVAYLKDYNSRVDLFQYIAREADFEIDRELKPKNARLNKTELAYIMLELQARAGKIPRDNR